MTSIERFSRCRIAVLGDLMLDCYISGRVNRISPEAPVPVLNVEAEQAVPGGAANVAVNLATLGVQVELLGLAGDDETCRQLTDALTATNRVDCAAIVREAGRQTTRKLRVIGAHQQIVRIDQDDVRPLPSDIERTCIERARALIDRNDVVVLSDYGKSFLSDAVLRAAIDHAVFRGKPVLVDPRRADFTAYRGATLLTPNRQELTTATRLPCETDEEAMQAAAAAREAFGGAIVLTRSEKGMSYLPADAPPFHLATVAQDVFDVSGAGDTVIAVLAAAIAADVAMPDALRMANHAAGIVVSKLGAASVTRDELAASLAASETSPSINDGRSLDLEAAVAQRWAWKSEKLVVGFANGCFDLLHPGHVSLLQQAMLVCDRLIVALNSDDSVRRLKGPGRPVQAEAARARVMGAIRGVSAVVIFDEDTPLKTIEALAPDVLIKGSDYTEDEVVGGDFVRARGGRVFLADLTPGQSTSRLVSVAVAAV